MQGPLKQRKLGSYEAKMLGKAEIVKLAFSLSKLHNFSTSQLPHSRGCNVGRQPLNKKGTPGLDVPRNLVVASATPYAGITQVRFEGYTLSLYGTPRIGYSLVNSTYPRRRGESRK